MKSSMVKNVPPASQIGINESAVSGNTQVVSPIYNLVPPPGIAAQFWVSRSPGRARFWIRMCVVGGDNGITTHINPVPERKIVFNSATFWGFPGQSSG